MEWVHEQCLLAWLGERAGTTPAAACEVCGTPFRIAVRAAPAPLAGFLHADVPVVAQLRAAGAFVLAYALALAAWGPGALRCALWVCTCALAFVLARQRTRLRAVPAAAAALAVLVLPGAGWHARAGTLAGALGEWHTVHWRDTALLTLLGAARAPHVAAAVLLPAHAAVLAMRAARHGGSLRAAWRRGGARFRAATTLWALAGAAALFWRAQGRTAHVAALALGVAALVALTAAHLRVATDPVSLLALHAGALYALCVALGVVVVFAAPPAWRLLGRATPVPTPAAPLTIPLPDALRALAPAPGAPCLIPLNHIAVSLGGGGSGVSVPGALEPHALTAAESCVPESYSPREDILHVVPEGVCPLAWKLNVARARGARAVAFLMDAPGIPPESVLSLDTNNNNNNNNNTEEEPALFVVPWRPDSTCRAALVPQDKDNNKDDVLLRLLHDKGKHRGSYPMLIPSQDVRWDPGEPPTARALAALGLLTGRTSYDCALVFGADGGGARLQCSDLASPCRLANFLHSPRDPALRECHFGATIHYLGFTAFVYLCVLLGVLVLAACTLCHVLSALCRILLPRARGNNNGVNENAAPQPAFFFPFPGEFQPFHLLDQDGMEEMYADEEEAEEEGEALPAPVLARASERETEVWLAVALLAAALALCLVRLLAPRGPRPLAAALVAAAGLCAVPGARLAAGLAALYHRWAAQRVRVRVGNYGPAHPHPHKHRRRCWCLQSDALLPVEE